MVRLTEAMLLLKHLAEALQSLQSCCQTIQHQLWIQNAQRLTSFSWRLASNLMLGAPKSGIYPKCTFPPFQKGRGLCWIVLGPHYVGASEKCSLHEVWWLWHTLDRRRELFNHMPKKMDTPVTWFSWNIVALHCTCRSLVQHHGQTHRGNAIAETPCQSPAEFAILLPNNSIPVVDSKWLKAFIIQLKTCIKPDPGTWQPRHSPKRDMGFAGLFWDRITLEQVRTVLFMTSCSNSCAVSMPDWMMSCLLRRALESQNVDGTNWLLSLASSQDIWKHLAEALHSLQSGGRQTFLYCLWPAAEAYKASIIQFLDLHQTRAWHSKYRHVSRKAVLKREPKKASLLPPLNGPVPIGVRCPCQTVWCLACSAELFKVIMMWTGQIGSCLWHPPKNAGNILRRLHIVCSLVAA